MRPGRPAALVYTGRMPTHDAPSHAPADAASPARFLALLDYDGTMTTHECNEIALQRFVGDAWQPLEVCGAGALCKGDFSGGTPVYSCTAGTTTDTQQQDVPDTIFLNNRSQTGITYSQSSCWYKRLLWSIHTYKYNS